MTDTIKRITLTKNQAQALADEHNTIVKDAYKIDADRAYLLLTDDSDNNMESSGECQYEISKYETISGNPEIIYISEKNVTFK